MGLPCDYIPLGIQLSLPAYGLVRTPLLVSYHFQNRSSHLMQLDLSMDASETFMFAGYKQVNLKGYLAIYLSVIVRGAVQN